MKWPKKWLDALTTEDEECFGYSDREAESTLRRLAKVGALKEPPTPREILWCPKCHGTFDWDTTEHFTMSSTRCFGKIIRLREVTEDE